MDDNTPELTKNPYTFNSFSARLLLWVLGPFYIISSLIFFNYLEPLEQIGTAVIAACWIVIIYGVYLHYPLKKRFVEPYDFVFKIIRKDQSTYFNSYSFSARRNTAYNRILQSYPIGHYVYIIKDASASGYYKIGRTNQPQRRIGRFEIILPFTIHIVAIISCEDEILLEAALHKQFSGKRINGEWFNLNGDDISWIVTHYGLLI